MPFEKKKKVGGGIISSETWIENKKCYREIVFCEAEKLSIIELILKDEEKKL